MNPMLEKIEVLLSDFQYVDVDHNRIVLTVGFTATFYFWDGHTSRKREALVKCFEAFEAAFGEHLALRRDSDRGSWVKLPEANPESLREYVGALDEDDRIEWYFSSGDDREAVAEYSISALTARGWMDKECSILRFQVPRSLPFDENGKKILLNLINFCCEQLEPYHANAGLNAVAPYQETAWEAEKFDLATRYNALYIDSFIVDKIQSPAGIKGVNWLTFVSNTLSEALGGPPSFVSYCRGAGVEPVRLGTGFMIQAGEYPQLGPVGMPSSEEYVRANRALRPLRNGNFGSMGTGSISGETRFDRCTSDLWIRRFDVPDTWPPKTLVGLPRLPLGAAPLKRIKLKSGEPCTIYGRYRKAGFVTPAAFGADVDIAPMVILLPGDIAPFFVQLGNHGEFLSREVVKWDLLAEL